MAKVKHFSVEVQPFHTWVSVVVAKTVNEGIKWANKNLIPKVKMDIDAEDSYAGMYAFRDYKGKEYNIIYLKEDCDYNTIVHESMHALMRISYARGARWSDDSDEHFAYSMGNFTGEIMTQIYGRRKE